MTNFYSEDDFKFIKNFICEQELRKIFITGYTQVGKSTFCKRFIDEVKGCQYIELDHERDMCPLANRNEVLCTAINKHKNNIYILEHWQLLDDEIQQTLRVWEKEADILIMLNPNNMSTKIAFRDYQERFKRLAGIEIYANKVTGTYIKRMNEINEKSLSK